ncbi:Nif11-like leader peptide family natural product precursor [Mangrovibacterium marinum]|uniref:Putative ribosomally synthesized peptide with nif11-like leader n=1 Tax=Mangrovibacterium marinum TaxID=1639118 RepID=A0A2T5C4H9_9BACT|nr:Nif11-like leader peptide family natural product precursor [Mangrovibacterium marinum]PTN09770.1 putative ribosomally synthesized peptide with nif11-like leader [Mangrovibacterium marinum]
MAINDAMKFIRESQKDYELRKQVNQCTPDDLFEKLKALGYEFDQSEFEESINMMHVKCQFEEQANQLMQTDMWFKMLLS